MTPIFSALLRDTQHMYARVAEGRELAGLNLQLVGVAVACGGIYGFTMGLHHSWIQAIASAVKVPILLLLTVAITFPALHGFQLFWGGKLRLAQTLAMALIGTATMAVLLASLCTVSLFFLFSGSNYNFMVIMHVVVFSITGVCGLLSVDRCRTAVLAEKGEEPESTIWLIRSWMILYMSVGTQVAYMVRPFIAEYQHEFILFADVGENFYTLVFGIIGGALGFGPHA